MPIGIKMLPSTPAKAKTGENTTTVIIVAPNTESRTSWQPSNTTSNTGRGWGEYLFSRRQR